MATEESRSPSLSLDRRRSSLTPPSSTKSSTNESSFGREWSFYGRPTTLAEHAPPPTERKRKQKPVKKPHWLQKLPSIQTLVILVNLLIIAIAIAIISVVSYVLVQKSAESVLGILEASEANNAIVQFSHVTENIERLNLFVSSLWLWGKLPFTTNPNLIAHQMLFLQSSNLTDTEEVYVVNMIPTIYISAALNSTNPPTFDVSTYNSSTLPNIIYYEQNTSCAVLDPNCTIATNTIAFTIEYIPYETNDYILATETHLSGWTTLTSAPNTQALITNIVPIFSLEQPEVLVFFSGVSLQLEGLGQTLNLFTSVISPDARIYLVVPETNLLSPICPSQGLIIVASQPNLDIIVPQSTDGIICFQEAVNVNDSIIATNSKAIVQKYGNWTNVPFDATLIQSNGFVTTTEQFFPFPGNPKTEAITWVMVVTVPKSVYLSQFNNTYRIGLPVAAIAAFVVGILASFCIVQQVIKSLKYTINQMALLTRLEFDKMKLKSADQRCQFKEVRELNASMLIITSGLKSFSKYVPREVVGLLVRLKKEAILGVDETELTVS
jgi:hypothetical protein